MSKIVKCEIIKSMAFDEPEIYLEAKDLKEAALKLIDKELVDLQGENINLNVKLTVIHPEK